MVVLVTYDVNTQTVEGQRRLRHVAKVCLNYGQRVQNSVFEVSVDPAQYITLKSELHEIIDNTLDSIRFYNLGKNWQRRVETLGQDNSYDPDKDLLIF